jgi:hypothetical protein
MTSAFACGLDAGVPSIIKLFDATLPGGSIVKIADLSLVELATALKPRR